MDKIRVIWKSKSGSKIGYLRLSFRKDGKTILKSIGVEGIEQKYFNPKEQRVRKSHPHHEELNEIIETKLLDLKSKGVQSGVFNGDKKSFLSFLESYLDRIINQGTKQKYNNLYNLLKEYNSTFGDVDIKFKDITIDYVEGFRKYLREKKNNTINSTNYKLKSFNSLLKKGIIEKQYFYQVYPFSGVKLKFQDKKVVVLTSDEIRDIMTKPLKEVYRNKERFGEIIEDKRVLKDKRYKHENTLNDIRRYFLFQFLCQGIRSSDLLTLRWNNFKIVGEEIRINKTMIKTKHEIDILVNFSLIELLIHYLPERWSDLYPKKHFITLLNYWVKIKEVRRDSGLYDNNDRIIKRESLEVEFSNIDKNWEKHSLSVPSLWGLNLGVKKIGENKFITTIQSIDFLIKNENENIKESNKNKENYDVVEDSYINKENNKTEKLIYLDNLKTHINKIIDDRLKRLEEDLEFYKNELYRCFMTSIRCIQKDKTLKNSFVFKLLNDKDFESINEKNDFGVMTKYQYNRFTGSRSYYNRLLKVVMKQCGIDKDVSSHTSRHTYTSIMLELGDNLNLHDLMSSLGHRHLSTTQTYLHRFNHKKVDELNKKLSDTFGKGF
jgi:integrase